MEKQKELLKSLLANRLDRVSILYNLKSLKSDCDENLPYVVLKYKLQLLVIDNISKESGGDDVCLDNLKKETEKMLTFYKQKVDSAKYKCCLVGCMFHCNRHRSYVRHLKRSHSRESNLVCHYSHTCVATFSTLELLHQHVQDVHAAPSMRSQVLAGQPGQQVLAALCCRCPHTKCLGYEFGNTRLLMLHMINEHSKKGDVVTCIFENCFKHFNTSGGLRSHFKRKHVSMGLIQLKPENMINQRNFQMTDVPDKDMEDIGDDFVEIDPHDYDAEESDIEENVAEEINTSQTAVEGSEDDQEIFLMAYCDFLNRLSNFHFIPQSTIQMIAEEYIKNYMKSNESKEEIIRKSLIEIPGISEADIKKVLNNIKDQDKFLEAQNLLNTNHKRQQYLKDKFIYVPPQEIILNPKAVKDKKESKAVVHYVPVDESFKNLVQDPSFVEAAENFIQNEDSETLKDVKDGLLYKNNSFFKENPSAFTMMIYSDAIELVNPLGAGRTKHKVIHIFFSLCEMPKHLRSKIDRIQLVAVFKEKLIKRFGFKKIYENLVKDLKLLEAGVKVDYPVERVVKCGVLIHPADNLEAHAVGGFSQSFSSKDICRWCHIQHEDLLDNIHDFNNKEHEKWKADEYDRAAEAVERRTRKDDEEYEIAEESEDNEKESDQEDEADSSCEESVCESDAEDDDIEEFGVKHCCPLNVLQAFHATTGFPPDLLHDVLEGVASQDLLGIIRILSRKGFFDIEDYNIKLKSLKYDSYESGDRPQLVPTSMKVGKLQGKACSIWVHVRYFPLVIRNFNVRKDDNALKLALKLHNITEGMLKKI